MSFEFCSSFHFDSFHLWTSTVTILGHFKRGRFCLGQILQNNLQQPVITTAPVSHLTLLHTVDSQSRNLLECMNYGSIPFTLTKLYPYFPSFRNVLKNNMSPLSIWQTSNNSGIWWHSNYSPFKTTQQLWINNFHWFGVPRPWRVCFESPQQSGEPGNGGRVVKAIRIVCVQLCCVCRFPGIWYVLCPTKFDVFHLLQK